VIKILLFYLASLNLFCKLECGIAKLTYIPVPALSVLNDLILYYVHNVTSTFFASGKSFSHSNNILCSSDGPTLH
jgi:hypothetical protein